MNRYSLLFAMVVAASFVAPTPHPGDAPGAQGAISKKAEKHIEGASAVTSLTNDLNQDVTDFLQKASRAGNAKPDILFATVPHPIETHLAADFDSNVAALEEGIQDSGYLFDTAWIPWELSKPYERLGDDLEERNVIEVEDGFPGVLLFRKNVSSPDSGTGQDPYANGLIVFLIAEKPTAGLEVPQLRRALAILKNYHIALQTPVRFDGPMYSGSLSSLGEAMDLLHKANPKANFVIRGEVTRGDKSQAAIARISAQMPQVKIDFGSVLRTYDQWKDSAMEQLDAMGILAKDVAFLSEDESLYGLSDEQPCSKQIKQKECSQSWKLPFPRDISALRTGYEKQGVLDRSTPIQPWKHFLSLQNDEAGEGDTIRSFGGTATTANQESVLFGISEFLKVHNIRAVIVTASNPADEYFLGQFFHANNNGVRIVLIGGTRLFLRGSTAQFRGDLVVDDFPMLPHLPDWTAGIPKPETNSGPPFVEHIFATGYSQGTYIATLDILASLRDPGEPLPWVPEYSTPGLNTGEHALLSPPMYITALAGNSPWPVSIRDEDSLIQGNSGAAFWNWSGGKAPSPDFLPWRVQLPITLYQSATRPDPEPPVAKISLHIGYFWIILFFAICGLISAYCVCFYFAKPVARRFCASFAPRAGGRYWIFTVALPALLAGCALTVLALPLVTPAVVSESIFRWWCGVATASVLSPLAIALIALERTQKVARLRQLPWGGWIVVSLLPTAAMFLLVIVQVGLLHCRAASKLPLLPWVLNAYREMHWESGLSLMPTWLFIISAFFLWTRQASYAGALLWQPPILPDFSDDVRISDCTAQSIASAALPVPGFVNHKWLWGVWIVASAIMASVVTFLPSFRAVTSLEDIIQTRLLLYAGTFLASLMLFDLLQFLELWNGLGGLLRALDSRLFKRSFVPIDGFKWPAMWSFGGVSPHDQRAVLSAQIDCIDLLYPELEGPKTNIMPDVASAVAQLRVTRELYRTRPESSISILKYREDLSRTFQSLALVGSEQAKGIVAKSYPDPQKLSVRAEALRRAIACGCREGSSRFRDESEEVERLLEWQQNSERLLCLLYIGFIQTVVARLHGLMLSVAAVFSLLSVAFAVYPFAPMSPFFLSGLTMLPLIAWGFFHVFSQMDTDPILSRIVNGDDRKLEWNFYGKFAEALALPLLTLASSFLPGGVGRILDVAQSLLSHTQ